MCVEMGNKMKYLWTEDTGAGLYFWQLANELFFGGKLEVESKGSNQGILDAVSHIDTNDNNIYYIAFDYVVDNQDIRNKYRLLRKYEAKSDNCIVILDMICLVLAFDKLVEWTGTGKKDKVKMRMEILETIENHHINLSKIQDEKTLK